MFDPNLNPSTLLTYFLNYLIFNLLILTVVIYNGKFLSSNQNFVRSLSFFSVYRNEASINLLNIHMLNQERTAFSFTYNHMFGYTSSFYFFVSAFTQF